MALRTAHQARQEEHLIDAIFAQPRPARSGASDQSSLAHRRRLIEPVGTSAGRRSPVEPCAWADSGCQAGMFGGSGFSRARAEAEATFLTARVSRRGQCPGRFNRRTISPSTQKLREPSRAPCRICVQSRCRFRTSSDQHALHDDMRAGASNGAPTRSGAYRAGGASWRLDELQLDEVSTQPGSHWMSSHALPTSGPCPVIVSSGGSVSLDFAPSGGPIRGMHLFG
jgi:hypothetical protein